MASYKNDNLFSSISSKIKPLVVIGGIIFCYLYVVRVIFSSFLGYNLPDKIFGAFLLLGETYILVHTIGYLLSIFKPADPSGKAAIEDPGPYDTPPVAVVVVARHEPREVLEKTLLSLTRLDYPSKKIYFLDDSSDPVYMREADVLGGMFGVQVFRRGARHGAKAGVLNDFIKGISEKYIAVFDADLNPVPEFLLKTVAIMERDSNLAFVQAPQYSSNMSDNPITAGAAVQQAIFYENVCERKSANNAMFCCGTNVVFRREALLSVGCFDESSVTEDFATSVKLHLKGYTSLFYSGVKAYGLAPGTLGAYFRQQTRWAAGTVRVFAWLLKLFIKDPGSMSALQWWEYFLSGTYYFVGWAFFLLMLCPVAYLLFGVPSFFHKTGIYAAAFVPCFLLTFLVFNSTGQKSRFKLKDIYRGTVLGLLGFPMLMRSALYGITGRQMVFEITQKSGCKTMPWKLLWPWFLLAGLNFAAVFAGLRTMAGSGFNTATAASTAWVAYYIFVILNIFYFNRASEPETETRREFSGAVGRLEPEELD